MYKNINYSLLSKILHHLALGNNFILEMLHDVEVFFLRKKLNLDNSKPHVFICGLPRSGTTILMRSLFETKQFASLTYRDMPFVLIPNLWSKISNNIKSKLPNERMHGDGININIDSPEALEEIFWRVKLKNKYIFSDKLIAHRSDEFTLNEFKNFVSLVLRKYKKEIYLSKNNNNLLRLDSIIQAFPNSLILILFRDPTQQANSLLSQHKRFTEIQNKNKFIKKYMAYLAHHEFGAIHRPYEFFKKNNSNFDRNSLEYWLMQWIKTYEYLAEKKFIENKNLIYINYDFMCENLMSVFKKISKKINFDISQYRTNFQLKKSIKKIEVKENPTLLEANNIFKKLEKVSINFFSN